VIGALRNSRRLAARGLDRRDGVADPRAVTRGQRAITD
jgi:hypothetical protein